MAKKKENRIDDSKDRTDTRMAYLIYFGLGGHGIEYIDTRRDTRVRGHISGYESPESFERTLSREKENYPPLARVHVLDKRSLLKRHPEYSFQSPLVDAGLESGVIDRVSVESARNMLPGLSGGFDTIAAGAIAHADAGRRGPGPLDSVSVRDYIEWWYSRGARLGQMDADGLRIIWKE